MPYIASTMSSNVDYIEYAPREGGGANVPIRTVTVKGGANVATRESGGLVTPAGLVTRVSEDDLAFLKGNAVFQTHMRAGHVKIMASDAKPEKFVKDMKARDPSAPLTDDDYTQGGRGAGASAPKLKMAS